ncbi:hypothetical protein IJ732_05305 [bacterium]|nr:hypothetical protein [bacterium]
MPSTGPYIALFVNEKSAKNFDETPDFIYNYNAGNGIDGVNSFLLYSDGTAGQWALNAWTHETRVQKCGNKSAPEACSALILENGYKIPDDYPFKF